MSDWMFLVPPIMMVIAFVTYIVCSSLFVTEKRVKLICEKLGIKDECSKP